MSTITTKDGTEIYYKDWTSASSVEPGSGQPIVFSHGWPLSGDDWDTQMMFFVNHGYRAATAASRTIAARMVDRASRGTATRWTRTRTISRRLSKRWI